MQELAARMTLSKVGFYFIVRAGGLNNQLKQKSNLVFRIAMKSLEINDKGHFLNGKTGRPREPCPFPGSRDEI
jgi:hypothetical protein